MTQHEIDLLADVYWWIKGYRAGVEFLSDSDFCGEHLEALRKARIELMTANKSKTESK